MRSTASPKRFHLLRAWGALVAFVGTLGLPIATASHQTWGDDPACRQTAATLDRATVHFEAVPPEVPAEHCAVCHWLRAARGARASATTAAVISHESAVALARPQVSLIASGVATHRPSRAPPRTLA